MVDAFIVEAVAATGCLALGLAARRGSAAKGKKREAFPPVTRSIALLPSRHRREARAIVALAHEYLARHADNSADVFTAREALRSYLPETLGAYLAVPPALRRRGRAADLSPDDELSRQLRTLRSGLEHLRESDFDRGAARMAANRSFLHERFGPLPPAQSRTLTTVHELIDLIAAYLHR